MCLLRARISVVEESTELSGKSDNDATNPYSVDESGDAAEKFTTPAAATAKYSFLLEAPEYSREVQCAAATLLLTAAY